VVAGVTLALERRPLAATAVCALAAMTKLPAAAAIALIAACWLREAATRAERARMLAAVGGCAAVLTALVGLVTTVGFSWISAGMLAAPGHAHAVSTPATAVGYTLHLLLGAGSSAHALESAIAVLALSATAVLGLVLLHRVQYRSLVGSLGAILFAAALGGAATWPWYLLWGLALLAADPRLGRLAAGPAVIVLASIAVRSDGRLVLQIGDAPYVAALYLLAAAAAVGISWRRERLPGVQRRARLLAGRVTTGPAPIAGMYDGSLSGRRDVAAACDPASR
jgi:hypothetical protein